MKSETDFWISVEIRGIIYNIWIEFPRQGNYQGFNDGKFSQVFHTFLLPCEKCVFWTLFLEKYILLRNLYEKKTGGLRVNIGRALDTLCASGNSWIWLSGWCYLTYICQTLRLSILVSLYDFCFTHFTGVLVFFTVQSILYCTVQSILFQVSDLLRWICAAANVESSSLYNNND